MPTLITTLVNLLLPVAVDEVKKKMQAKSDQKAESTATPVPDAPVITTHEAAIPALQATFSGAVTSKTAWFSVALLVLGFLEQNQQLLTNLIPAQYMGVVIAGIGFLSLLLRATTTTSLVEKAQPKE